MAQDLNTTKELLLMHAAREGGWTTKDLDHNQPLNNPFGVNKIAKGQAVGNVNYPSLNAAIEYYEGRFGDRVRGTQTPEDFAYGLQHPKNGQRFNSADPKYEEHLKGLYSSVLKFEKLCGIH
jgi:hypothetical protein